MASILTRVVLRIRMFITDSGSKIFHAGSGIRGWKDPEFVTKNLGVNYLTHKSVPKISEIWLEIFIQDPYFSIPDPDPGGQKSTGSRIRILSTDLQGAA